MAQEQQQKLPYSKHSLEQAIVLYQNLAAVNSWHTFPDKLLIRPNDTSRYVPLLQENLLLTGDLPLDSASTDDSVYTSAIENAVKRFQARHGLIADGVVGPNTIAAINVPLAQRVWQLQQNLARWDTTLATAAQPYVLINLPDYHLFVVDSGQTVLQMRVIIGKPDFRTFPVKSKVDMVVFHPYWYVPRSIAVNEIVPLLRRNPGYLATKDMQLQQSTAIGWIRVNPWSVNWKEINASNYDYRIVQLSGNENELGQVKFPFPNKVSQYMHDTPHKALFEYPDRAFSHGCIRLEKPMKLAYYVLENGSGFSPKKIDRLWNKYKPNHYIQVKKPLPLYIIYQTAWADENMQVQFREDIYGLYKPQKLTKE